MTETTTRDPDTASSLGEAIKGRLEERQRTEKKIKRALVGFFLIYAVSIAFIVVWMFMEPETITGEWYFGLAVFLYAIVINQFQLTSSKQTRKELEILEQIADGRAGD